MEGIVETAPKTKPATPPQNAATVATANADGKTTEANVACCGPLEARFHKAVLDHPTKITALFVAGVFGRHVHASFPDENGVFRRGESRVLRKGHDSIYCNMAGSRYPHLHPT